MVSGLLVSIHDPSLYKISTRVSLPVRARPDDNIIFEDKSDAADQSTLPPFPKLELQDNTLPPFPSLIALRMMRPEQLNSLMYEAAAGQGYVYDRPEIPFETKDNSVFDGYFYDRPKNPMELPSTPVMTTTEEDPLIDFPEANARILGTR